MKIACYDCGREFPVDSFPVRCGCGGLLTVHQTFHSVDAEKLKATFHERLQERGTSYASGVWRYKELICPDLPDSFIVTKYEGNTGLYAAQAARDYAGLRQVWLKAQSENPSGSFKDNGMTVAVSFGRFTGSTSFACSSTGNTSSSLAMYAAVAGCRSVVLVPEHDVSISKVLQTAAYGAEIIRFPGTYDDGIRFLEKRGAELGLYVCNSVNPFRIEGQKSIAFELAQDLSWSLPDWIVVPGGALSNVSALGKALRELKELGFIDKLPQVAVIQAEGASPFHRMVNSGLPELAPEPTPRTIASALNIGNPPSWRKALQVLQETQGITASVSDAEIMAAKAVIDRSGIGCEPASAAALAGLRKLVLAGTIHKEETAACILTGNMLKDTDALKGYLSSSTVQKERRIEA
ncbi:threonine synthase [Gorillibacterium massiliense]|uniref:threonine synthase n=1 Tax=Gorillibacterium massiliense TaxID=1280390 RepID=UPI0004B49EBE|nr:threonine synthase [Gorillibacterium massiliense]